MFEFLQNLVVFAISLATLIGAVWALIDCLKRPEGAFTAAGKWSKTVWTIIISVATLLAFVMMPSLGWIGGSGPGVLGAGMGSCRLNFWASAVKSRPLISGS